MPFIPIEIAVIVFAMFAIGTVALGVALRVKLAGNLEPLSRRARWYVRGLFAAVVVAMTIIVLLFRHALGD